MSGQCVGIVGDEQLAASVEAAGAVPIERHSDRFDTVAFVLARGEMAITDLARAEVDVPILPIDAGRGLQSVSTDRVESAIAYALDGDLPTMTHPVVAASGSFTPVESVFDVALMTATPARISEFSVHSGDEQIARFRADGVVTSTPAGSAGYNRSAGGPVIESGTGVASVVPIAPFATFAGHWVLPIESVRLSVERDETPVELLSDGRRERTVTAGTSVTLSRCGSIETYVLPSEAV